MKRQTFRLVMVGLGLAALAMFGVVVSCSGGKDATAAVGAATPVIVEKVKRDDVADVLSYVADLKPYAEVKVYSPVPDRIIYFPWQDGQVVRQGERLALIRKESLDKGLEQMVAQMEALDAQIHNLDAELSRSKDLLAAGVITRQTFDQVQTSYLSTVAQRKALEASRGQLAVTASNAVITAPIAGVVAGKMLETGDMAVPQLPLCQLYDLTRMKARLKLIEIDIQKVKINQEVSLAIDAYPGRTFKGVVTSILPYLDQGTRTNSAEVTFDNPLEPTTGTRALKAGMFGTAKIVVGIHTQALVAPEPALLLDSRLLAEQRAGSELRKAFVIDAENVARERKVRLGARTGSTFEVMEGLAEGDTLVVRGQHGLKDGQKVRIVEKEPS